MKWVLNTYRTCEEWSVDQIVDVCTKTGYAGVEFLMDAGQRHGIEADASTADIEAAAQKIHGAGLIVASLTSGKRFDSTDPAERRANVEHVKKVIDHAVRMKCDQIRMLGDRVPPPGAAREERIDNIAAAMTALAEYAGPHGVTVSMEMHSDFADPELSAAVMERVNLPNAGLVFNCVWRVGDWEGWSLPDGAPSIRPIYDLTRKWWTNVHTHQIEEEGPAGHWPYYRELFALLKEDGYDGPISNECSYVGPDPEKVLRLYTTIFEMCTA